MRTQNIICLIIHLLTFSLACLFPMVKFKLLIPVFFPSSVLNSEISVLSQNCRFLLFLMKETSEVLKEKNSPSSSQLQQSRGSSLL